MALPGRDCRTAEPADEVGAVRVAMDEVLTALEESFHDLSDEQFWGFPLPDRHNIVSLVMHCLMNLNEYGVVAQGGRGVLEYEDRFEIWYHGPKELRPRMVDLPGVAEVRDRLHAVREAIEARLDATAVADLRTTRGKREWCREHNRTAGGAYWRTICHTHAHVRQIWLYRGRFRAADNDRGWPDQHYA